VDVEWCPVPDQRSLEVDWLADAHQSADLWDGSSSFTSLPGNDHVFADVMPGGADCVHGSDVRPVLRDGEPEKYEAGGVRQQIVPGSQWPVARCQ